MLLYIFCSDMQGRACIIIEINDCTDYARKGRPQLGTT